MWGWSPHSQKWEVGVLQTPKNSELDCRGQISLHLSVLGVVGKFLKCKCSKWPRMSHLDICNPSYGQKKGRESNWQFDSRPLKVRNRPLPNFRWQSATWCWKAFEESYNFGLDLTPIESCSREIWAPKVPGLQPGTVSRLLLRSPGKKSHSNVASAGICKIYDKKFLAIVDAFQEWHHWFAELQHEIIVYLDHKNCSTSWQLVFWIDAKFGGHYLCL